MRRFALVLCLLAFVAGCGGDKDKGVNKDRDKPRSEVTHK